MSAPLPAWRRRLLGLIAAAILAADRPTPNRPNRMALAGALAAALAVGGLAALLAAPWPAPEATPALWTSTPGPAGR